jgi:hypothetical protein
MAEMALAAFGALGTGASAIGGMSTVMTVLSGVATAGSVLMKMSEARAAEASGLAAAQEAGFNADMARIEADSEANASASRAVELRRETMRKIGAARVAFAGSGLDMSSGQLVASERDLERQAAFGLEIEDSNRRLALAQGAARAGQYEIKAQGARAAADARSSGAMLDAGITGAKGLLSIIKRG